MKLQITNRNGTDLALITEGESSASGLAFVIHGLGGIKEQNHIRAVTEVLLKKNYTVVTYDAAHTIGESAGKMELATLTSYFEDLEDVVEWAKTQSWYKEPFLLSGHSLGGACSIMYAAKYPEKAKAIIPISAFIAGELFKSVQDPKVLSGWKKDGYQLKPSKSKPGVVKKIGWGFVEDAMKHDLREIAEKIECSALFITGSEDRGTPAEHQQMVIDNMHTPAELHVVKGMEHNPSSQSQLDEIMNIVDRWLKQ